MKLFFAGIFPAGLSPIHMLHGFKTGLAAVLAYAVTTVFNLEFGYWAVISTVIVMQVYVADSVEMCLYRLSGTLIGAALGTFVMTIIPHTPVWTGTALFFTIGICAFLTRYKTRYRMAAITVVIIIMTGAADPDILVFGISRVGEIGLGIICAFGVSVLIFPKRKADVLKARLASQARDCHTLGSKLVRAFNLRQQHVAETPIENLENQVRGNQAFFLAIHRHEARIYRLKDNFQERVFLMGRAAEHLRTMARILNGLDGEGHEIILAGELEEIAQAAGQTLMDLMTDPPDQSDQRVSPDRGTDRLTDLIRQLDDRLLDIRKEGLTARFGLKRLVQVFSFYNSLKYYAEDILAGAETIRDKTSRP